MSNGTVYGNLDERDLTVTTTATITVDMQMGNYSPIISEHDSRMYRVLVTQRGNLYTLFTGDGMTRLLEDTALPDEVRSKLAMVKAFSNKKRLRPATDFDIWSPMDMYANTFPPEFDDIGWHCRSMSLEDRELYCVVISTETLELLRGERNAK